jgi:hypothetical protein
LTEVGIDFVVRKLTPVGQLHDLWLALCFCHLIEFALIGGQRGERLGSRGRGVNQDRSSQTVIELAAVVRVVPGIRKLGLTTIDRHSYVPVLTVLQRGICVGIVCSSIDRILSTGRQQDSGAIINRVDSRHARYSIRPRAEGLEDTVRM